MTTKEFREWKGWGYSEMGRHFGLSHSVIWKIENGQDARGSTWARLNYLSGGRIKLRDHYDEEGVRFEA